MKKTDYERELEELEHLRRVVEQSLLNAPKGRMRCEMAKGKYPQYYIIDDETKEKHPTGKYLRKEEMAAARDYVQKEYDYKMLRELDKRIKDIKQLLAISETSEIKNLYGKLPYAKRCLIQPYVLSDDEFVTEWENTKSLWDNTYPIINEFYTEKGEIVRSKTEKMIADKLYLRNIPYKYEEGMRLGRNGMVFPDFTMLNKRTRREYYLEHFGMMDNPEYCKLAIEKIEMYEENGIHLGERLFATFESSLKSVNLKMIDNLLDRILL